MALFGAKKLPDSSYLSECFVYDNGVLFWAARRPEHFKTTVGWHTHTKRFAGKVAGRLVAGRRSYWQVMLDGERAASARGEQ